MKIYNNASLNRKHLNGVIAIGNFDGLHLGHQKVINEARKITAGTTPPTNTLMDAQTSALASNAAPRLMSGAKAQSDHETRLGFVLPARVSRR